MSEPKLRLDVRGLPPPEPLEHCLDALADLKPGQRLEMRIDREPFPLYAILERDGFAHSCDFQQDHYLVAIWIP